MAGYPQLIKPTCIVQIYEVATAPKNSVTCCARSVTIGPTIRNRRGAMLPLVCIMMTVLLLFTGLMIDSNYIMLARTETQTAADLAAKSALLHLQVDSNQNGRLGRAKTIGSDVLNLNPVAGRERKIASARIHFGRLENPDVHNPVFVRNESRQDISAVRIEAPFALFNQRVKLLIAPMFGVDQVNVTTEAISATRQIDVVLCLDASRSMTAKPQGGQPPGGLFDGPPVPGSRWFVLMETVGQFLNALKEVNPNARVGLVTLGGGKISPRVPSPLDLELARTEQGLESVLSSDGINRVLRSYVSLPALGLATSLFDGLEFSTDLLIAESQTVNTDRVVIFLSDGAQALVDRPEPTVAASRAAANGVRVHTVSFGGRISVMEDIAQIARGDHFSAASGNDLKDVFVALLGKFNPRLAD